MTETSRHQSDSPSESLSSPVITTSKNSPPTAQTSSDNKLSQAPTSVDPHVMEQDHAEVSDDHEGGGFDPNGHYQNAYMSISQGTTGVSKAQNQQPIIAHTEGLPTGQNTRRNANQSKVGDAVLHFKGQFQKHVDSGDEAQDNIIGRARRDMGRYPGPFRGNSDDSDFDTTDPIKMAHRGHGKLNAFDSPSAGRRYRRTVGQYQQEQRDGRNDCHVLGRPQQNDDSGDDFRAIDDCHENDGYAPQRFQRVTPTAGLPEPRFPVIPTAPSVKGRVVKQSLRRGDQIFTGVGDNGDTSFENSDFQDSNMGDDEYDEYARYSQDASPNYGTPMIEDEEYDGENQTERMFVPEPGFRRPNRVEKNRAGASNPSAVRPIANNTAPSGAGRPHPAVARRAKDAGKPRIIFGSPSRNLAPSRYSGAMMPWGVNQQPVLVDQHTVSDAHLKKRGLTRPPPGEKVGKRSYGANDPENVAIVNMKENDKMNFAQIAEALNLRRVESGRAPNLTVCGVNGRYNRTAPILFATQGMKFVPLSERKKAGGAKAHGSSNSKAGWTPESEDRLVEIVKQVDAEKWARVAQMLNADLYNGRAVHDATTCAKRYAAL